MQGRLDLWATRLGFLFVLLACFYFAGHAGISLL